MAFKTRGEIRQAVMDRLGSPGDLITDDRLMRVINDAIDDVVARVCNFAPWDSLRSWVSLPVTGTTTRVALGDGATVLDSFGNIAPYMANVHHVELVSTGDPLEHDTLIRQSFMLDNSQFATRGNPSKWDSEGRWLYVKPLPSGVDALGVFAQLAATPFVSDTQEPLIPERYRGIIVHGVMAQLWSVDGEDVRKQAYAREMFKLDLGTMLQYEKTAQPDFKAIPLMPYATNR